MNRVVFDLRSHLGTSTSVFLHCFISCAAWQSEQCITCYSHDTSLNNSTQQFFLFNVIYDTLIYKTFKLLQTYEDNICIPNTHKILWLLLPLQNKWRFTLSYFIVLLKCTVITFSGWAGQDVVNYQLLYWNFQQSLSLDKAKTRMLWPNSERWSVSAFGFQR